MSGVLARAEAWLLEPAPASLALQAGRSAPPAVVVAVIGLSRGCGTTTLARALAAELAGRHHGGAAVVSCASAGHPSLATAAARRLARALGADARACGRLALYGGDPAELRFSRDVPVVLDVGHGTPPEAALALADRALLVASPDVEPALAGVAVRSLVRDGAAPLVVLNRATDDDERWRAVADVTVGESRMAARLALSGREAIGALGAAASVLADACEEVAVHA
jgi:hypothetical protein